MISKMKKIKIVVLKPYVEEVLKSIQKTESLMIIKQENEANKNITFDGLIARSNNAIKNVSKFSKKKASNEYLSVDISELDSISLKDDIINHIDELLNRLNVCKSTIKSLNDEIKSYYPISTLSISLIELKGTKHTKGHLGSYLTKYNDMFNKIVDDYQLKYEVLNSVKNVNYVCFFNHIDDEIELINKVKTIGFTDFKYPEYDGYIQDFISNKVKEVESLEKEVEDINSELTSLTSLIPKLKIYVDSLMTKKERVEASYSETSSVYLIEGWIPDNKVDNVIKSVESVTAYYDYELLEPLEGENVPTYTINNKVVSSYEGITNMFSVPSATELDPNPIMAFWYWIIMGMMVGDVGYGFVLLFGALLFILIKKPPKGTKDLAKVLLYSSVTAILFGILFNSYFGFSMPFYDGIKPMEDALPMLILSVGVGVLHILTGLVMKVIKEIINKNIGEMLAKGLSWIFILVGISLFAVTFVISNEVIKTVSLVLIVLGVLLILVFAGWKKKNILSKSVSGLVGLYDVTGYMGDILSYTRIMALVMSSAAVASAMNILASKVSEGKTIIGYLFAVIIFVVGHLFNLVLGLLSAYVHDCRLQYIEFYGKFYDGGGIEFKPLSIKTRYINEIRK